MAELFQRDRSVISKHIKNIFEEGELPKEGNVQILHIANSDKPVEFYNLDVIISGGYRQILEIYATSIDYNPKAEISHSVFSESSEQNSLCYSWADSSECYLHKGGFGKGLS